MSISFSVVSNLAVTTRIAIEYSREDFFSQSINVYFLIKVQLVFNI